MKTRNMGGDLVWILCISLTLAFACNDKDDDNQTDGDQYTIVDGDTTDSEEDTMVDGDQDSMENESEDDNEELISQTVFSPYVEEEKTVAYVDLPRYLGKWYEIATYTIPFQEGCTGSTATYSLNEDESISVANECFLESLNGEYKIDTARAEVVNTDSNAELVVYFTEDFGADYWIIELDGQDTEEPYEWAVVGSSLSIFLWVLNRTPQMDNGRLDLILERLETRGYDLDNLDFTIQPEE